VCQGNTKTKQNLSPLPKRCKDMALQVPFLASGLYSFMAIACVFDELKFEDFYYNQATLSELRVSMSIALS